MQTIYRFHRLRGASALRYYYADIDLITPDAQRKYKALQFFDKHGLGATLDAFSISRSTLFRWKKSFKNGEYKKVSLNPRSRRPRTFRASSINPLIIKKIREIREIYPNMSKDKIFHLQEFRDYCNFLHCKIPSISTQNYC